MTNPRIAVLSALSNPDWHPGREARGMPWADAEALLAAYDASHAAAPAAPARATAERAGCPCATGVASDQCSPRGCAPSSVPAAATGRRDRFAAAVNTIVGYPSAAMVNAVMAVADAELTHQVEVDEQRLHAQVVRAVAAEAEVERLRANRATDTSHLAADRAAVLREAATMAGELAEELRGSGGEFAADREAGAAQVSQALFDLADEAEAGAAIRRLADEAQQPETEAAPWPTGATYVVERRDADEWVGITHRCKTIAEARKRRESYRRPRPGLRLRIVRLDESATVAETDPAPATRPGGGVAEDNDPICGDRHDDEVCELEPGHDGAHCAGTLCWDYGRAPATAATEEHRPPCGDREHRHIGPCAHYAPAPTEEPTP